MKTITKFIFGIPMLALACGSIAFAEVLPPVTPADSAAKAAAQGPAPVGAVTETVTFESGSSWHLTVDAVKKFGLVITGASFQRSPASPFIYVLFDGRLGEIMVPYHEGSPRFRDISYYNFDALTLPAAQFPPPRQIIGGGKICKEVRDYLAYMNFFGTNRVRYGQEVVYFGVLGAANYQYIMEWTFRDDGAIMVRAGSTGPKNGGSDDTRGHMHDFTWRLDIDLNGANGDSAYLTSHLEKKLLLPVPFPYDPYDPGSTGEDSMDLIEKEGSRFWRPQNFNTLEIFDRTLLNGNGRHTAYELVPMRSGTARHNEPYTKADFWVTRYNPAEILAVNLPTYISDQQSTENADIVLWYTGSAHHEGTGVGGQGDGPRDEDFNTVPVLWTGFDLIPHNLFNKTPFYPGPTPSHSP
jgi:Cu2+-containing amine oxidase